MLLTKSADREDFRVLEGRFKGKTTTVNNQGEEKSIGHDSLKIDDLKEINIKVYLRNGKEFIGTGWKPKNKDNPFIFFRE